MSGCCGPTWTNSRRPPKGSRRFRSRRRWPTCSSTGEIAFTRSWATRSSPAHGNGQRYASLVAVASVKAPWRGFVGALQFLTRFPLPTRENGLGQALGWLPLVGLLIGLVLGLVDLGLSWLGVTPLLASTVIVVLLLVISGALHADGVMDAYDAVFGHATPERRLESMRDPRTGAFGVAGLVSVIALK